MTSDPFADLGRYYDALMKEVDYDRWIVVTSLLAELLPANFRHVDLACGTGRMLKRLVQHKWNSVGIDFSAGMLREAKRGPYVAPLARADLCALPFGRRFHYATCAFDSLNFLLEEEQLRAAMREAAGLLLDGGVFYFDVITERMVTQHFADRQWAEDNGGFSTRWEGRYDRNTRIAELEIRVNTGPSYTTRERVYTPDQIKAAIEAAGLTLLGEFNAMNWKKPTYRSIRVDYVAMRNPPKGIEKKLDEVGPRIRQALGK
jgi:SAM-dependent methyltransferase